MTENDASPFLTGKLLVAMPSLGDPRFHRAVIFMCSHDENGAMGLVVNHVLPGLNFNEITDKIQKTGDDAEFPAALGLPVYGGGPVEPQRGFLLHSPDFSRDDTIRITDDFHVTGTVDALKAVACGQGPEKTLFILGYAGWSAGQIEEEMRQNAWITSEPDHELVFGTPPDERWAKSLNKIGVAPSMLSSEAGRA